MSTNTTVINGTRLALEQPVLVTSNGSHYHLPHTTHQRPICAAASNDCRPRTIETARAFKDPCEACLSALEEIPSLIDLTHVHRGTAAEGERPTAEE